MLALWVLAAVASAKDPRTQPKKKRAAVNTEAPPKPPTPKAKEPEPVIQAKIPKPKEPEPATKASTPKAKEPEPAIQADKSIKKPTDFIGDAIRKRKELKPDPPKTQATEDLQVPVVAKEGLLDLLQSVAARALDQNTSAYLWVVDTLESKTVPALAFCRQHERAGTLLFTIMATLVFLKTLGLLFRRKKPETAKPESALLQAIEAQTTLLAVQIAGVKGDLDKVAGGLAGKVAELQKQVEKWGGEKRDEEQMEFLFGNLGDMWKEITNLKTRINDVDGGGSNILSFNSKMEFKGLERKDRGGLEDDDDSNSRKNAALEPGNRILPRELSGHSVSVLSKDEPKFAEKKTLPEAKERPSLSQWASPARPAEVKSVVSRLDISPVSSKQNLPNPGIAPAPPTFAHPVSKPDAEDPQAPEAPIDKGEIAYKRQNRPEEPPKEDNPASRSPPGEAAVAPPPEDETPVPFKPLSIQPRVPPPTGLPKIAKKGPQMHRALPPRAPGTPVPKPSDSGNLI